jgi:hypothetical protein
MSKYTIPVRPLRAAPSKTSVTLPAIPGPGSTPVSAINMGLSLNCRTEAIDELNADENVLDVAQ